MSSPTPRPQAMRAEANPAFDAWKAGFRGRALAAGIPGNVLDPALQGAGFLPDVIARDRRQAEFTRTFEDYLIGIAASEERIAAGRAALARQSATLRAIEARFGVEPEIITAIWGLESRYGAERGDIPVISATATLAFDGRRGPFFESQLLAALRILARGDTNVSNLRGSWAGAMGHTQFIPTTFQDYAVDFTGNGRRDIWAEDPTDALASAANYLARMGWRRGQPWGMEVRLPDGFNTGATGRDTFRPVAAWNAAGLQRMAGGAIPDHGEAAILLPDGARGPAFAIWRNFNVILRYNNSTFYGVGVGHLADRIAGGGPIRGTFQPDNNGLRLAERQEMQRLLTRAGHDTGGTSGTVGPMTETAIRDWQQRRGLAVTGQPSQALLGQLRGGA